MIFFLNLPTKVTLSNAYGRAEKRYLYSADGRKLRVSATSSGTTKTTDYAGSRIYENGTLKRTLVDGGYIENGQYYFFLTDHLGNTRVVAQSDGTVVQTNHYYPYGLSFADGLQTSTQPYKYNGKEFDGEHGLNLYDYVARLMDPTLGGRFQTIDPLAEKYYSISPYAYCANNPVKYVDIDGRELKIWYKNSQGQDRAYMYKGGAVTVDNAFVNQVAAAYRYNKQNGGGAPTISAVEGNAVIGVVETNYETLYSSNDNTIFWNPSLGMKTDNGSVLSPATSFDHEADHAVDNLTKPDAHKVAVDTPDAQYDTKEERRVITGSEQKTARANGELNGNSVTRSNHRGKNVITNGVTSTTVNQIKTSEFEKRLKKYHDDNMWPE